MVNVIQHINWQFNADGSEGSDAIDKFRNSSDGHSYEHLYSKILPTASRILEIGIFKGAFAHFCKTQISSEIFMVGAEMHTYDTPETAMFDDLYTGDAYSEDFLNWIKENNYHKSFDFVIDDGPHTVQSQVWSIRNCAEMMTDNGVYLCEDIQTPENAVTIARNSPFPENTYLWDNRQMHGRYDDICVVVDRKNIFDKSLKLLVPSAD